MIIMSNHPFDISAIIDEYPQNSVERQLLEKMSQSLREFRYDTVNQLKFELRLRKEIVNASEELFRSKMSFTVFHKSRCNEEYWDRTENGGFRLKPGAIPSEAINDIFMNGYKYATECATAIIIVCYKALLNIFGEEPFNKLFPKIYLMNWHSIDPLLKEVGIPRKVEDILIGDRGYFANPDVDPKTPEWQGENVIVLPDGMYYGHGVGIGTAEKMIYALNVNRRKDATRSAHFLDSVSRPNFKKLADIYQSAVPQTTSLVWRAFPPAIEAHRF